MYDICNSPQALIQIFNKLKLNWYMYMYGVYLFGPQSYQMWLQMKYEHLRLEPEMMHLSS
jgi:hypothetical protein